MPKDQQIEAIFTTADDQMQGLWGLHRCVKAAADLTEPTALVSQLPQNAFILTHEWVRFYDPREMAEEVHKMREFLLARQSLLILVSICEAALLRFNEHLATLQRCVIFSKNSKLLEWAFGIVRTSPVASPEASVRLPQTCGDLDNARRLRNCIVHRNGCYDKRMYVEQAIDDGWIVPQYENDWKAAPIEGKPILLGTSRFEHFTRSHIEFLHILHNTIQKNEFRNTDPYSYANECKRIEWHRILNGRRDVKL